MYQKPQTPLVDRHGNPVAIQKCAPGNPRKMAKRRAFNSDTFFERLDLRAHPAHMSIESMGKR